MKRNTHIIGAILFAVIGTVIIKILLNGTIPNNIIRLFYILLNMRILLLLLMVISSVIGGIIPDILDPPFTKRHRRYAHSKILLLIFLTLSCITVVLIYLQRDNFMLWFIYYFLIGYISHLILDSLTPAGLW